MVWSAVLATFIDGLLARLGGQGKLPRARCTLELAGELLG